VGEAARSCVLSATAVIVHADPEAPPRHNYL
jgi:hypothetical protein